MDTQKITEFLESLSDQIEQSQIDLYRKIIESSGIKQISDYEEFYSAVIYPFENFVRGFVQSEISSNPNVVFIMQNSYFVEIHFRKMFEKFEGSACSADKSRTIVKCLLSYFKNGKQIEFDYNVKYTFNLPIRIFTTHQDIIQFYEAIKSLFYGNGEKYLFALKELFVDRKNPEQG